MKNDADTVSSGGRLVSLDALRGFTMFWILGGDSIGHALAQMEWSGGVGALTHQLDHVAWEGFRFYDLIFPLFVFIVGVSLVYSLNKIVSQEGRRAALRRVAVRTVILYALGIFYYDGWMEGWERVRLLGVLQRLALCYGAAGILFLYFRPRALAGWCLGLLVGYWALLTFVPVPGVGPGDFSEGNNLTNWIDAQYLPLRKWDGDHDPEGLLSTLPAIASCLLGVLAGVHLRRSDLSAQGKAQWLAAAGVVALGLGFLWGLQFPIIKKIWTSSYVLVAGGYSALLLALFYWVIDLRGWKAWAKPCVWIGMNPITIYMLGNMVAFDEISARLLGGPVATFFNQQIAAGLGQVMISLGGMLLAVGICGWLYSRKIFLRI